MAVIQGFFFDLDGTLVDTYEADFLAYRDAIREVTGITIEREAFTMTNGQEMRFKLQSLVPDVSEDRYPLIAQAKKQAYPNYIDRTTPNTALIDFLASHAKVHVMGLVTSAKRQNASLVLETYGLTKYFSVLVYGDEVANPKPAPDSYRLALDRAGLSADQVIAFEDSESGLAAAQAAGISVVRIAMEPQL